MPFYRGRFIKSRGRLLNDLPEMAFYRGRFAEHQGILPDDPGCPINPAGILAGDLGQPDQRLERRGEPHGDVNNLKLGERRNGAGERLAPFFCF